MERKMALLGAASPPRPTVPRRHRSGYHGAEQGSGTPCAGWVMGRGSLHATGARSRGRLVVGMVSLVSQHGQGERSTWIWGGGDTRVTMGKGTPRCRRGLTRPCPSVTHGQRG